MNTKLICLSAILILFLFAFGTVFAQTQIGVTPGETFTYTVDSNSNIPQIFQIVKSPKDVQTLEVTINSVNSQSAVTLNITQQFKNGTETSWIENKDLTQASNFPMIFGNLSVNDKLWSNEALSPVVNSTTTHTYSDGVREISNATVGSTESGYDRVDYSFDRSTGMPILVKFVESENISTVLTLTNTSLWTVPEFPTSLFLISSLVIALFVILSIKKGKFLSSKAPGIKVYA